MTVNFLTFGGGKQNFIEASERLNTQAQKSSLFDNVYLYTDQMLMADSDFWGLHSDFINRNKRGWGYWIWKPYIIKQVMDKMNDNDTLVYLDSGCEIDMRKKKDMLSLFEIIKDEYVIGSKTHNEMDWCKMDLFVHLDMLDIDVNSKQHEAGALMFRVCDKTRVLVDEWYKTCCNYHLIDDSPSNNKNFRSFKEHRHDQAIFSLLTKKYELLSEYNISYAFNYHRNRTGISRLPPT